MDISDFQLLIFNFEGSAQNPNTTGRTVKIIQLLFFNLSCLVILEQSLEAYSNAPKWMKAKAEKYLELFRLTEGMTYQEKLDFLADWSQKYPDKHTSYPSLSKALKRYNQGGLIALLSNYGCHRKGLNKTTDECFESFKSIYL